MEGTSNLSRSTLGIEPGGDPGGIRVLVEDLAERRPRPVQQRYSLEIELGEAFAGPLSRAHPPLQLRDAHLKELEVVVGPQPGDCGKVT